ncbi:hypothetical protein [Marivita sp. XM-24bin2]|jgi:hypothetical protein|uniref:hypothetical protein n=1 Tax=unclassified Marivita TaxID=2632480 RepID=UPI000D79AE0F|nr:hypothetical protein [Marivita sp. XM-24bin2]MCR9110110.1 hypothetical protein [Paracoccaceae bacterium]PWL34270.1 MAG: hypothetical protein DCO97_15170 [Marivita sp. XM-24bin2]
MPAQFQILPQQNLVYVRYSGVMLVEDSLKAFGAYAQHPDARPGQRHLIDLSRITDMERDFARIMQLQATKAADLAMRETETLMVYFANTPVSLRAAALAKNGWSASQGVIAIVQESEEAAMQALGLSFDRFDDLLQTSLRDID